MAPTGSYLRARATRWVSDEPQPGVVEVELVDGAGRVWRFEDKAAVFDRHGVLGPTSAYPIDIFIACTVLHWEEDAITVTTAVPWGLEATDGRFEFVVKPEQMWERLSGE